MRGDRSLCGAGASDRAAVASSWSERVNERLTSRETESLSETRDKRYLSFRLRSIPERNTAFKYYLHWFYQVSLSDYGEWYDSWKGHFNGGLRHGDLLSPYLFLMVADEIHYHPLCSEIKFTHLHFADDLVIFLGGKVEDLRVVLLILENLYQLSGLKLNSMKTEFYLGGFSADSITNILAISGFEQGSLPVKYIGIPLVSGKEIHYHPLCSEIKFTHLHFADDLVIFLGGKVEDLRVVLLILENLYQLSGLKLNSMKTEFYLGGFSADSITNILAISGFEQGSLPVKYIGIPLVSGKVTTSEIVHLC
ncbi:hypothetical protein NL676_008686 [Syzygium grande]|nr:hypothetical protein NL676_008686 [Syzygium grande]